MIAAPSPERLGRAPESACARDNPVTKLDDAILHGIFQPVVDALGIDPNRTVRILVLVHALLMAAMYAAYLVLDAAGIAVVSKFETSIGIPVYGVVEVGFLLMYARLRDYVAQNPVVGAGRVLMTTLAIVMTFYLPRVVFGSSADEYLDVNGHTPFALRQGTGSYILSRWTFAAVMYLTICRKPPPRRMKSFA